MSLIEQVREIRAQHAHMPESRIDVSRQSLQREIARATSQRDRQQTRRRRRVLLTMGGMGAALLSAVAVTGIVVTILGTPAQLIPYGAAPAISIDASDYIDGPGALYADAPVYRNVDELVAVSEVGATGVIASFAQGRIHTPGDEYDFEPVIARIDDVQLLSGRLSAGFDGSLYIALPGYASPEEYAESMKVGTPLAFYGNDLLKENAIALEGVPDGQGVYNVVHPSGLVLEYPAVEQANPHSTVPTATVIVFPMEGTVIANRSLDALDPGQPLPEFTANG